jgi:hypothetical protein
VTLPTAPTIEKAIKLGVAESETLDLKRESYTDSKEWLKDVTAFANTTGGRILIGIDEDKHGKATAAPGFVPAGGMDQEIQRLNNWLRDLSEPDVSAAVRITAEEDDTGKHFLVVDVEESSQAPHRVTIKSEKVGRQVYVRKARDNVPASMAEIKDIVVGVNRTPRLISEFVEERRLKLPRSNPLTTNLDRYLAFHAAPRRGFGSRALADWVLAHEDVLLGNREDLDWSRTRPNLLGAVSGSSSRAASDDRNYHQVFNNGAVELVYTRLLFQPGEREDNAEHVVPGPWLKRYVTLHLARMLAVMFEATGCDQFEVATTLAGVGGLKLVWKDPQRFDESSRDTPWEHTFAIPSVTVRIGADGQPLAEDLHQILDLIWRAWGESECPI